MPMLFYDNLLQRRAAVLGATFSPARHPAVLSPPLSSSPPLVKVSDHSSLVVAKFNNCGGVISPGVSAVVLPFLFLTSKAV